MDIQRAQPGRQLYAAGQGCVEQSKPVDSVSRLDTLRIAQSTD